MCPNRSWFIRSLAAYVSSKTSRISESGPVSTDMNTPLVVWGIISRNWAARIHFNRVHGKMNGCNRISNPYLRE
jgi:hypothetical protein